MFEALSELPIHAQTLLREIERTVSQFLGDYLLAKAGFMIVEQKNHKGIIKVNNVYTDHIRAGLMLVHAVEQQPVALHVTNVSGILHKVKEEKNAA